jgi:hypothetical protein
LLASLGQEEPAEDDSELPIQLASKSGAEANSSIVVDYVPIVKTLLHNPYAVPKASKKKKKKK